MAAGTQEAFGQVVANLERCTELIGEIATASQEQARGIAQVNDAVSEMDRITWSYFKCPVTQQMRCPVNAYPQSILTRDRRLSGPALLSVCRLQRIDMAAHRHGPHGD